MRAVLLSICLLLIACPGPGLQTRGQYPAEITGIGESENFPISVAGYTRGKMYIHEPGMKNLSIAYDVFGPTLQNAVTLYLYEAAAPLAEQFLAEKSQIAKAHPGAVLVREGPVTLQKSGVSYQGYSATYTFTALFAQREQLVSSQLILVAHPARYFKVRSTAPAAQETIAELSTRELLEEVAWAY